MKKEFVSENMSMTKSIINRFIKRDFSGNTGLAIKNSSYLFITNIVAKIGALIFTIILAKCLLSVELFGLYTLTLSTIIIFSTLSDLGIGLTLVRYISKYEKNSGRFINYLRHLRSRLIFISGIFLIATSYFIANFYYQKPITLALIAGSLYIFSTGMLSFISGIYQGENNFKILFVKEIIFQTVRLFFVPIVILLLISSPERILLASIFLALAVCYFITFLFLYFNSSNYDFEKISENEKKEVIKFMLPLSVMAFSGIFFGQIDIIMLGRFVDSIYIAYYQAAFALVSSGIVLISFGTALLPIFSKLKQNHLERGLKKSILATAPFSFLGIIFTILFAPVIIRIIYNSNYTPAILVLQSFTILFLLVPIIGIYNSYYMSKGRTYFVSKALVVSTLINIVLNYILIKTFLNFYGQEIAIYGAVIATIISHIFYLSLFIFGKRI